MKIVFLVRNAWYFRHFDRVVRILCGKGHSVRVLVVTESKKSLFGKVLKECHDEVTDCHVEYLPPHNKRRLRLLAQMEELINYAHYFKPQWPSPAIIERWEKKFLSRSRLYPRLIQAFIKNGVIQRILISYNIQRILKKLVEIVPPDRRVIQWLKEYRPDIVVASPYIFTSYLEVEYVRAAQHLSIPTLASLASWDNLTTKGTFHLMPDIFTVWNNPLLKEAVDVHEVPPDRIVVTGSPTFDMWFDMKPTMERDVICSQVGIDLDQPYVVYLCSSYSIAGDETAFVRAFLDSLRQNPDTKNVNIIIRPHPIYADNWLGFLEQKCSVWPKAGGVPGLPESRQDFFNMLYHSLAVVGVNTSAFLEAAIVDKPCMTIMTEHYHNTQVEGFAHFQHLLDAEFLEIAESFVESAEIIAKILTGIDSKALERHAFVRDFIRPRGIEMSASKILADTVETVARDSVVC